MKGVVWHNTEALQMQAYLIACSLENCQIVNNLVANIKKEEHSPHASSSALSAVLCYFPPKEDFSSISIM